MPRDSVGSRAEMLAADYLMRHGLAIVARNFRTRFGEIENQFNKVKQSADDSQRIFDAYSKMLETVNKDLDALE